ncbi:MAG: hypothetical protein HC815_05920 [Richelia sp. RM1_1_1]|nr:hypothetical protein [Richelia sp. RM1_1_1]
MFKTKSTTNTKKEKTQPMRLLSYGTASSAPVAITSLASTVFSGLCLLLIIANYGATSAVSKYTKGTTLIQLNDGSTAVGKFTAPNVRSDAVISSFVGNSMISLFSWDGILRLEENGKLIQSVDKGVKIVSENGEKLIPTDVWEAAFTLSEEQDFRASFLKKLAETVPEGILRGQGTIVLVTNYISAPRKVSEGKWEVDIVANLITFNAERSKSKGVEFNKIVTVRSVDVPPNPPKVNDINEKVYKAKIQGLEIVQIIDLDLGKKKK